MEILQNGDVGASKFSRKKLKENTLHYRNLINDIKKCVHYFKTNFGTFEMILTEISRKIKNQRTTDNACERL